MKLEYRGGLLFASLTLAHGRRAVTVTNVIVDTGAADTIIDIIAVEPLQLAADEDDVIVRMAGLGVLTTRFARPSTRSRSPGIP